MKLSFVCLLLFANCSFGQFSPEARSYYESYNNYLRTNHHKNYDSSIYYLQKALKAKPDDAGMLMKMGEVYCLEGQYKKAVLQFSKAVCRGYILDDPKYFFNNYDSVKNDAIVKTFLKEYDSLSLIGYCNTDGKFRKLINTIYTKDQYCRQFQSYGKGIDSVKKAFFAELMRTTDSLNAKEIKAYITVNGFPAMNKMTVETQRHWGFILHHILMYNEWEQELHFDDSVRKAVYNGTYPRAMYIMTLDYAQLAKNQKQLFGTYKNNTPEGCMIFPPLDNIETVDARRKEWLIQTLAEESETSDCHLKLPEGYKK